jgi:hypothetical protein
MYYFISVIMISMLPSGEPFIERSITGPFVNQNDCYTYQNVVQNIVEQTLTSQLLEAECKEFKLKGKQANG